MVQEIYISYYYNYLHSHLNQRYHYMRHLQFIRHQLIHMFTMGQTDIQIGRASCRERVYVLV